MGAVIQEESIADGNPRPSRFNEGFRAQTRHDQPQDIMKHLLLDIGTRHLV